MPNIVLQTQNLTKSYGPLTAIKNLSLDVYEGEVFATADGDPIISIISGRDNE